jgi:hypothetical protein
MDATRTFSSAPSFLSSLMTAAARSALLAVLLAGPALLAKSALANGESLAKGDALQSENGQYEMVFREDGRLAVYRRTGEEVATLSPRWESEGDGFEGPGTLVVQPDNNVVIYDSRGTPRWHTGTFEESRETPARLVLEDDGALNLWSGSRRLWCSGPHFQVRFGMGSKQVAFP